MDLHTCKLTACMANHHLSWVSYHQNGCFPGSDMLVDSKNFPVFNRNATNMVFLRDFPEIIAHLFGLVSYFMTPVFSTGMHVLLGFFFLVQDLFPFHVFQCFPAIGTQWAKFETWNERLRQGLSNQMSSDSLTLYLDVP